MCTRYGFVEFSELGKLDIGSMIKDLKMQPRYNIAPNTQVPVIRFEQGTQVNEMMYWGFPLPDGKPVLNARMETIQEKPMFAATFKRQRCIMPGDCFYEFAKIPGQKEMQAYKITNRNGGKLFMAGLWKDSVNETGRIKRVCMCTTEPNSLIAEIHDRMPVILTPDQLEEWLMSGEIVGPAYEKYKCPYPSDLLACEEVNEFVNNVRNEGPKCWDKPKKENLLF